jgi:hypothetical protein
LTLYGLAAEGFRPGGISTSEGSNSPDCLAELATLGFSEFPTGYTADSLWSYELGAKSRWLDGRAWLKRKQGHPRLYPAKQQTEVID